MCLSGGEVFAGTMLSFFRVTANAGTDVASQFKVEVMDEAEAEATFPGIDVPTGDVFFAFTNDVGLASSISEIYFDDGTIIGAPTIFNSIAGSTDFGAGANPSNLPGGNTVSPAFQATSTFSVDAQGNPSKGIDTALDVLGLSYDLQGSLELEDVITSLFDGSLRIGMHVRAIGPFSDSFVNVPPLDPSGDPEIPEPSTLMLALLSTSAAGFRRRR